MRLVLLFSLFCLSLAKLEFDTYNEYLVFAAKNHHKSVSDYALAIGVNDLDKQFEEFIIKFERTYSADELEERKFYFLRALKLVNDNNVLFNEGKVTHELGINQFSDFSPAEYHSMLTVEPMPVNLTLGAPVIESDPTLYAALPASFDWRAQNKVSPIKNQAQCGSCWAFATVAIVESAFLRLRNQVVNLAEQQLVDCSKGGSYNNGGCKGGWVPLALTYIKERGIENTADYQYMARDQNCMDNPGRPHVRVSGYKQLPHPFSDDQLMQAIMTEGPVAVNVDASGDDFGHYRGGILTTGNRNLNHYVTAVGWGPNYWIIKNSWGTGWGQGGYAQFAKGQNVRGINQFGFTPTL